MRKSPASRWWRLCLAFGVLMTLSIATPALAQIKPPPAAPALDHKKPWFQWLAGTGIIGVVCLAAFKNPKRGK